MYTLYYCQTLIQSIYITFLLILVFSERIIFFRDCEDSTVTECSIKNVTKFCPEMKISTKCQPRPDCEMFSCRNVPVTK